MTVVSGLPLIFPRFAGVLSVLPRRRRLYAVTRQAKTGHIVVLSSSSRRDPR